jgi:hypothetical protein
MQLYMRTCSREGVRMDRTRLPTGLRGSKSIRVCLPNGEQHPLAHAKEWRSCAGPTLTCHRLTPRVPARTTILLAPAQWRPRSDRVVHAQAHVVPAAGAQPCPPARQGCSWPHAGGARHSAGAPTSSMRRCQPLRCCRAPQR